MNGNRKRIVWKANKGIKVEKYNRFKKLKIKIIKKRKVKKMEEERKKENTELQKPNVEAEGYSNNKKCDWIDMQS